MLSKKQHPEVCRTFLFKIIEPQSSHLPDSRTIVILDYLRINSFRQIKRLEQIQVQVRHLCATARPLLVTFPIPRTPLRQYMDIGFVRLAFSRPYPDPDISFVAYRRIFRRVDLDDNNITLRKRNLLHRHRRRRQKMSVGFYAAKRCPFFVINAPPRNGSVIFDTEKQISRLAIPGNVVGEGTYRLSNLIGLVECARALDMLIFKRRYELLELLLGHHSPPLRHGQKVKYSSLRARISSIILALRPSGSFTLSPGKSLSPSALLSLRPLKMPSTTLRSP